MTAKLTIVFGPDVLKALRQSTSIRVAAGSAGGNGRARRAASASASKPAAAKAGPGGFREGSLPAKLVAWAGGRKRPFDVPEVMKAMKIKRGHASMLLTSVMRKGGVKRVGRGEYAAA